MALLHYGYAQLNLKTITANTELGNQASQHVLLKAGLHRVANRRFTHEAYAHFGEVASFERDAADWLAEFVPLSTDEAAVAGVRIQ
jgi:RimJ/RimL family protein N-acetyltransferase